MRIRSRKSLPRVGNLTILQGNVDIERRFYREMSTLKDDFTGKWRHRKTFKTDMGL